MEIKFTARRFRARPELRDHALATVGRLERFYDGIVTADVILSFEGSTKSAKCAEVNLHVYGGLLTAKETSDDYLKSIDAAVGKMTMQLSKYKTKLRMKDKSKVRAIKDKV
jgi:putative sigma-54 modulation protein